MLNDIQLAAIQCLLAVVLRSSCVNSIEKTTKQGCMLVVSFSILYSRHAARLCVEVIISLYHFTDKVKIKSSYSSGRAVQDKVPVQETLPMPEVQPCTYV